MFGVKNPDSLPIVRSGSHIVSPSRCRSSPRSAMRSALSWRSRSGSGSECRSRRSAPSDWRRTTDGFPPSRSRRTPCRCPSTTARGAAAATRAGRRVPRRRSRIMPSVVGTRIDSHGGGLRVALRPRVGRRAVSGPSSHRRRPASRRSRSRRGRWRGTPRVRRPPRGRRTAPAASARESTAGGRRQRAVPR